MPTPAEEALAEGFEALDEVHAQTCTFGAASFAGRVAAVRPDSPRMPGGAEHTLEIRISPANRPEQVPTRGTEFLHGATRYRVAAAPFIDRATGETVIPVVET